MAIQIITDSAADYSVKEVEKRNITCIPMAVSFGERQYLDGINLEKNLFYELLTKSKEFPKTSQPAPTQFLECFEAAKEKGDSVIAILLSGALSGTLQSAYLAKDMAEYDKIYIIDSKTVTLGMRILVDQAVMLRKRGASVTEIITRLEELKPKIRVCAGLETLEYLYKGGRLSRGQASLGTLANLKPLVAISPEGEVKMIGKQIGMRRACKELAGLVAEDGIDFNYPLYFIYSYEQDNCLTFIHALKKQGIEIEEPKTREIGPTIGSHIGPGAFGVVYVAKC